MSILIYYWEEEICFFPQAMKLEGYDLGSIIAGLTSQWENLSEDEHNIKSSKGWRKK
jgi:hypothetical protein